MARSVASGVTTCSVCGEQLNAKGECLACLVRAALDKPVTESGPQSLVFGDFEVVRREDGSLWELGHGGMGVTYLALDTVLRRKVALKVIELPKAARTSDAVRERFLREARAAASLRHPNVATVFRFGASPNERHCYYAMELIEGETLQEHVHRDGPLNAKLVLEIAIQTVRALTAAAAQGVIHRDLKPGNIMLTRGDADTAEVEVKVIDFGLAKAIAEAGSEMDLTRGGFVGTPNFASPEQFESGPVDVRADIYSLGAALWFALTGKTPFAGCTIEEICSAQKSNALPVEQLEAARVPSRLQSLLKSMLAFEPAGRPGVQELAAALRNRLGVINSMPTQRTEQRKLAAIMFTDMVGYSALVQKNEALALKLLEEHRQLLRPLFCKHEGTEIKTIGDAFLVEFTSTLEAIHCAAEIQKILKDYNASPDRDFKIQIRVGLHMGDVVYRENDVFGDGVNIASRIEPLAKPGGICLSQQVYDQVHNKFAGKFIKLGAVDLKNIQAPLNVYRLVLPWEKRRWAFTNQLAFRVRQKKTRAAVVIALVVFLLGIVSWQVFLKMRPDARALFQSAKILAQHSSGHLEGKENNPRIINLLERSVKADPNFAEAYADLALAYVIRLFLYAPEDKTLEEKAYWAVDRALSLNPNLPTAYLARGRLKWTPFNHFPHEDAINDFKHALALDPKIDEAHHYLGLVFLHVGLMEEARAEFSAAIALNPSNNGAQYRLGETLFYEGKFREARNVIETIGADFNPDLKESQLAWAMFSSGEADEAISGIQNYLQQHPEDKGGLLGSVEAMMFAATGKRDEAERRIAIAETKRGFGHFHHTEYNIACAYALMNKTDKSVEWFEKATGDGFNCYPMFEKDPSLDNVRNDSRFREIMAIERKKWEYYRSKFGRFNTASIAAWTAPRAGDTTRPKPPQRELSRVARTLLAP